MKKLVIAQLAFILLVVGFSCKKNDTLTAGDQSAAANKIPQEKLDKIKNLGFSTVGAYKYETGYMVEGDIFLDEISLNDSLPGANLIVAKEEHYRTTYLVTHNTYTVRYTGGSAAVRAALINAVARFNAEHLDVKFNYQTPIQGIFSRGLDLSGITVKDVTDNPSYIASAGFPTPPGYRSVPVPYNTILFNTAYAGWDANTLTTVLAHEIGHCIGFRHTDYMNRSYSGCLVDASHPGNEGVGSAGAVHISGTPVGPDPDSWMLSCIGNGTNRPFNANDRIALNYLY